MLDLTYNYNQTEDYNIEYITLQENNNDNYLFFGDNYYGLTYLIDELEYNGKVDLVYIDPPYNTGNTFKMGNTMSKGKDSNVAYVDKLPLDTYLGFMSERLKLIHKLLSNKGSFYLHCDYKVGHYLKVLCDTVFGISNFRADITRVKCNSKNFKQRNYGNIKDCILFYTKSDEYIWNYPRIPFTEEDINRLYNKVDENGERYCTQSLNAPGEVSEGDTGKAWRGRLPPKGRHWCTNQSVLDEWDKNGLIEWSKTGNPRKKIYAKDRIKEGKVLQDIWEFKDPPRVEYPTTKSKDLLEIIIGASSNKDSIVCDCFCGSGSTCGVARSLGRKYIGMDNGGESIKLLKRDFMDSTWVEII